MKRAPMQPKSTICWGSKAVYEKLSRPKISYGFDKKADYFIKELKQNDVLQEFIIVKNSTGKEISLKLALAGRHNALNATAAFIVSQKAGINIKIIKESFMNFGGVSRRMEHKGEIIINKNKVKLIDDYGHHPTEIKATIDAVKATNPSKKI